MLSVRPYASICRNGDLVALRCTRGIIRVYVGLAVLLYNEIFLAIMQYAPWTNCYGIDIDTNGERRTAEMIGAPSDEYSESVAFFDE